MYVPVGDGVGMIERRRARAKRGESTYDTLSVTLQCEAQVEMASGLLTFESRDLPKKTNRHFLSVAEPIIICLHDGGPCFSVICRRAFDDSVEVKSCRNCRYQRQ